MNIKPSGSCFILKKKLRARFPLDEYRHSFTNFFKVSLFTPEYNSAQGASINKYYTHVRKEFAFKKCLTEKKKQKQNPRPFRTCSFRWNQSDL